MNRFFTRLPPLTLQRKSILFVLLPLFLMLSAAGVLGLVLIRDTLLGQWQESAISKLQRSAHHVDMRLNRPKELLRFLSNGSDRLNQQTLQVVVAQLRAMDGVVAVKQQWHDSSMPSRHGPMMARTPHHLNPLTLSTPAFDTDLGSETVTLSAQFATDSGEPLGSIEVVLSFYDLIDQIVKAPWWQSNTAFLVDPRGNILASTTLGEHGRQTRGTRQKFGDSDPLEVDTLVAMQSQNHGILFDDAMPPERVSGFYQLSEAPWTMVIIASGDQVLAPIISFRFYYFMFSGGGIVLALLYLRHISNRLSRTIGNLSDAATDLAAGRFGPKLPVTGSDEVAELTKSFNAMTRQLQERFELRQDMDIARNIQQQLLPDSGYRDPTCDIFGTSVYCQATGGDYVDLLLPITPGEPVRVVVGDVVGHGIGAALLMATVRALVRSRADRGGSPAEVVRDVNRLLCHDTSRSGNFVTLFYLALSSDRRELLWTRGGHESALVYFPESNEFTELKGPGLALGVNPEYSYQSRSLVIPDTGVHLLIGSDGVWDTENEAGQRFGRERVRELLLTNCQAGAEETVRNILAALAHFRGDRNQSDDITMVVIKIDPRSGKELSGQ